MQTILIKNFWSSCGKTFVPFKFSIKLGFHLNPKKLVWILQLKFEKLSIQGTEKYLNKVFISLINIEKILYLKIISSYQKLEFQRIAVEKIMWNLGLEFLKKFYKIQVIQTLCNRNFNIILYKQILKFRNSNLKMFQFKAQKSFELEPREFYSY